MTASHSKLLLASRNNLRGSFRILVAGLAFFFLAAQSRPAAPPQAGQSGRDSGKNSPKSQKSPREKVVFQGIEVGFDIDPVNAEEKTSGSFVEGEDVAVRFTIADARSRTPLAGSAPLAWMDPVGQVPLTDCSKKVAGFINGGLLSKPAIDLNAYYVLALNGDSTISVVDPHFEFGGTKLLALVALDSQGEDWGLTSDQSKLFVSMPDSNAVAVVDTRTWKKIAGIPVEGRPSRLAIQPDQHYLWAAYGDPKTSGDSGVIAISATELTVSARIPTGRGPHELAFSNDSRFVFVTNGQAGTVSVIDVRSLKKLKDLRTGRHPTAIAFSSLSKLAYVIDETDGTIAAIDSVKHQVVATRQVQPGLCGIKFAPGDLHGFVANPLKNVVYIFDASNNQVVQSVEIRDQPDQITFSSGLAYVRRRGSETVVMIPLDQLGKTDKPVSVMDFPAGQRALGKVSRPSPAETIVQAPDNKAVLVANPADKTIYYYMEGMAAPKGSFSNYSREPRAVLVVDRSFRERSPGVYETTARLTQPGMHYVAFFLNSPRITHCFRVWVDPDPEKLKQREAPINVEPLIERRILRVREMARLRFKLTTAGTGAPRTGLDDVRALAFLAPGTWHQRLPAKEIGEGVYEIEFAPPESGVYYVYLESAAAGLKVNNPQYVVLEVTN